MLHVSFAIIKAEDDHVWLFSVLLTQDLMMCCHVTSPQEHLIQCADAENKVFILYLITIRKKPISYYVVKRWLLKPAFKQSLNQRVFELFDFSSSSYKALT